MLTARITLLHISRCPIPLQSAHPRYIAAAAFCNRQPRTGRQHQRAHLDANREASMCEEGKRPQKPGWEKVRVLCHTWNKDCCSLVPHQCTAFGARNRHKALFKSKHKVLSAFFAATTALSCLPIGLSCPPPPLSFYPHPPDNQPCT